MNDNNLELEKFRFEKAKSEREFLLKERELSIKEKEIKNNRSKTATYVAIFGVLCTVLGTCIAALLQGNNSLKLERKKFESDIILKVATSDSIERNKKNLIPECARA